GKGSLFLDEINSMPIMLQSKLLRALQEKKIRRIGGKTETDIQCRTISATNRDPFECDEEKESEIRMDLLFRLSATIVKIPPLRERKEDIPELCQYFMRKGNQNKSIFLWDISPQLLDLFNRYDWPGNVRELENVVQSSIIFADNQERFLKPEHIPEHIRQSLSKKSGGEKFVPIISTLKESVADFEKRFITDVLFRTNGNISNTARILGITRQSLYAKMEKYRIDAHIITKNNPNVNKN
ncbi:MAG: sigma 54-interacting transcriptional regulator, partial [Clostridia bacterium]